MNDKEKIEKLTPFDETKYKNIDLDHLIMYVMGKLEKIGVDLSFENAVVASFKLFPKIFLLGFLFLVLVNPRSSSTEKFEYLPFSGSFEF